MKICPCCSNIDFNECCGPLLNGEKTPSTPEALMRSRYTAFTLKNIDYIYETTDPQARHTFDVEGNRAWSEDFEFTKLEILSSSEDGNKGFVEFKAYYQAKDMPVNIHHEQSKFRKQKGTWYFKDGKVLPTT